MQEFINDPYAWAMLGLLAIGSIAFFITLKIVGSIKIEESPEPPTEFWERKTFSQDELVDDLPCSERYDCDPICKGCLVQDHLFNKRNTKK